MWQHCHEPAIAVLRYLKRFTDPSEVPAARINELENNSNPVLDVLDRRLRITDWLAGGEHTIADLALYSYRRLSGEAWLDVQKQRQAISGWLDLLENVKGFLPVYSDAATEAIDFEQHFSI